jgi:broad specificity phosphatase PhoE
MVYESMYFQKKPPLPPWPTPWQFMVEHSEMKPKLQALWAGAHLASALLHAAALRDVISSMRTTVHLLRHGEVHNPDKLLYGRLPGYRLSELGHEMAQRAAEALSSRDVTAVIASPLERAQQTAAPIAGVLGLTIGTDENLIEAENVFEGQRVSVGDGVLRQPSAWRHLYNPFKPSWGEPYAVIAARMRQAVADARDSARGHEAVLVSHQLPIWISRLDFEGKRFPHDPRKRQCSLASLTSLTFDDDALVAVLYTEPSADLLGKASKVAGA